MCKEKMSQVHQKFKENKKVECAFVRWHKATVLNVFWYIFIFSAKTSLLVYVNLIDVTAFLMLLFKTKRMVTIGGHYMIPPICLQTKNYLMRLHLEKWKKFQIVLKPVFDKVKMLIWWLIIKRMQRCRQFFNFLYRKVSLIY